MALLTYHIYLLTTCKCFRNKKDINNVSTDMFSQGSIWFVTISLSIGCSAKNIHPAFQHESRSLKEDWNEISKVFHRVDQFQHLE